MQAASASPDDAAVAHLARTWAEHCLVKQKKAPMVSSSAFDRSIPDYPLGLLPFHNHPLFEGAPEEQRQEVLTWGWIGYNLRTIGSEDRVINPALELIAADTFAGVDGSDYRTAIRQTMVDEHYHSLMHLQAIERTLLQRGLTAQPKLPGSLVYRKLCEFRENLPPWQAKLASVTFAVVAEVSVPAYLNLIAKDATIQPENSQLTECHNRDEYRHAKLLSQVCRTMFVHMNAEERSCFIEYLPAALTAYVSQDVSMWAVILQHVGIEGAEEIIEDAKVNSATRHLVRDYRGVHGIVRDLGIAGAVQFDFSRNI